LFAAAEHARVPWTLAKAVCDFGHGKSKEYQPLAAAVAASLVAHVLKDPAMLDGLPAANETEDVDRASNADVDERVDINPAADINLAGVGSERFRGLCFELARAELGYARKMGMGLNQKGGEDIVAVMYVPDKAAKAVMTVLICKAGARSDEEMIASIEASLNPWPAYHPLAASWTLCIPMKPTAKLRAWFETEMRRRRWKFDIWDEHRPPRVAHEAPGGARGVLLPFEC